ncbi:hypothetical protein [Streptomyces sp. NBC_01373]|uniref:hypothetical protein n=1 Tax=Streptomyces sp. NBC_01373 TaxID=2903843 RepID=UPI0022510DBE|nr:hypothetical protein [Streptomyces sp. NBC_01373]MCX4703905.1 hypothetical protein [Streptomyces sp. NBC_01373]
MTSTNSPQPAMTMRQIRDALGHPPTVASSVHEIRHEVRIDLTDAPPLADLVGRRRKPVGVHLIYGLRRDISRVDVAVQWEDEAQWWSPSCEMPGWLRRIVDRYRPSDVDEPDEGRPTGRGGWPVVVPAVVVGGEPGTNQ